jgi:hypothetical protein
MPAGSGRNCRRANHCTPLRRWVPLSPLSAATTHARSPPRIPCARNLAQICVGSGPQRMATGLRAASWIPGRQGVAGSGGTRGPCGVGRVVAHTLTLLPRSRAQKRATNHRPATPPARAHGHHRRRTTTAHTHTDGGKIHPPPRRARHHRAAGGRRGARFLFNFLTTLSRSFLIHMPPLSSRRRKPTAWPARPRLLFFSRRPL